jgi:hypothetical protein
MFIFINNSTLNKYMDDNRIIERSTMTSSQFNTIIGEVLPDLRNRTKWIYGIRFKSGKQIIFPYPASNVDEAIMPFIHRSDKELLLIKTSTRTPLGFESPITDYIDMRQITDVMIADTVAS